jgi:hypothetical protein
VLGEWLYDDIELTVNYSVPDGKVCLNASGELAVTKFAVEPVGNSPKSGFYY